jgi:Ca2+-binding RTX toxin-like protein
MCRGAKMTKRHLIATAALLVGMLPTLVGLGAQAAEAAATPTCFGKEVTVMGTPGDDHIEPTGGVVDVIWTGGGNDTIAGEVEGDYVTDVGDYYCMGPGNDTVRSGAGGDHIRGGLGADAIHGWRGADVMNGGAGNDVIEDDSIDSNDAADDVFRGGPGDDRLGGGWGHENFFGGAGHDTIIDAECTEKSHLYGGRHSDHLESHQSSFDGEFCGESAEVGDIVNGGGGSDTLDNYDYAQVSEDDIVSEMERTIRYSVG